MFTGIVETCGTIARITAVEKGVRMVVDAPGLNFSDVRVGDSICVDGICLTAVAVEAGSFAVDVSQETMDRTAGLREGAEVNLEKALRLSDRLGGHLVSGHVDGCGVSFFASGATPAGRDFFLSGSTLRFRIVS